MCVLDLERLKELAKNWLQEFAAINSFNFTGFVIEDHESEFEVVMKTPGVLAGTLFVDAVISHIKAKSLWYHRDGDRITSYTRVASLFGSKEQLLLAERVVLNILSRASGVATNASKIHEILESFKWEGILSGTCNTTPGFNTVENYALLLGGANMRAHDFSDMIVLRESHISVAGSVEKAVERVHGMSGGVSRRIKVECKSLLQALCAAKYGCDIVMFSNIRPSVLLQYAIELKLYCPSILVEASGDIKAEDIRFYASSLIDIISTKYLFEGYPTIDFSMKIKTETITLN